MRQSQEALENVGKIIRSGESNDKNNNRKHNSAYFNVLGSSWNRHCISNSVFGNNRR